jgi:hypothetical protein
MLLNLDPMPLGAIANILVAVLLLFLFYQILMAFYSNFLINYFKLEQKYPKLEKYFKLRSNFQHFYIIINTLLIFAVLIYILYVNITVFMLY